MDSSIVSFFRSRIELIIGVVIGLIIAGGLYCYLTDWHKVPFTPEVTQYSRHTKAKIDTVKFGNYVLEINERTQIEVKERNEILEQKMKSMDDRLTDFRTLLGFIITLMLAIVAAVYIKTEAEVEKHMSINYNSYKSKIEGILGESNNLLAQIQTAAKLSTTIIDNKQQQEAPKVDEISDDKKQQQGESKEDQTLNEKGNTNTPPE